MIHERPCLLAALAVAGLALPAAPQCLPAAEEASLTGAAGAGFRRRPLEGGQSMRNCAYRRAAPLAFIAAAFTMTLSSASVLAQSEILLRYLGV